MNRIIPYKLAKELKVIDKVFNLWKESVAFNTTDRDRIEKLVFTDWKKDKFHLIIDSDAWNFIIKN